MTFDDVLCSVSGGLLASRPIEEQESQLLGKGEKNIAVHSPPSPPPVHSLCRAELSV